MNKKEYIIPNTECFETRYEMSFLASANGTGTGSNLSSPTVLSGGFDDYFN